MILLAAFRAAYPEFNGAGDTLVNAKLVEAAASISAELYSADTDKAHGLLTAHLLSLSPAGQQARLQSDKGKTTYGAEFEKLREAATCGIRVF